MVEVKPHPHTGNKGILQGLATIALFGTAFYFLFLHSKKAYGQGSGNETKAEPDSKAPFDETTLPPAYWGRKEYKSADGNPRNSIKGFDLPEKITDLQEVDSHIIVMTKPDSKGLFGGIKGRSKIRLYRHGNKLVYYGFINGVKDSYFENYDDVKDKMVLTKNIFIKNFKLQ